MWRKVRFGRAVYSVFVGLRHCPYAFSCFAVVPILSPFWSTEFLPWNLGKTNLCWSLEGIGFLPRRLVQLAVVVITPTI